MGNVEVVLDADSGEGHLLIRDTVTYEELKDAFAQLDEQGWVDVDPREAEAVDFPDGSYGVKTYLCRKDGLA